MTIQSQNKLSYEEADNNVLAFDEWLEAQSEPVQDTVYQHIAALTNALPNFGEKSAKLLLAEVYILARRHIHIENKYGGKEL